MTKLANGIYNGDTYSKISEEEASWKNDHDATTSVYTTSKEEKEELQSMAKIDRSKNINRDTTILRYQR